jgi:hypothetical protein
MLALLPVLTFAADPDPLTALATGTAAYLTTAVVHEVVGHGGTCALAGGRPTGFSTTYMVCDTSGMGPGDVRAGTFMGSGANLVVGTTMASGLFSRRNDPWTHHYLWTATSAQLFLAGSYLVTGGIFGNGDFGEYLSTVDPDRRTGTAIGLTAAGAGVLGLTFPLAMVGAEPMLGGDRASRRSRARILGWVPYLGAGVGLMTATGALNREQGPADGATAALVGYGLGTLYVAYLPLLIPAKPPRSSEGATAPPMERSAAWLAIGAASLAGLVVLGSGVGDLDPAALDDWRDPLR